ncbi:MAG: histidine kinase [bacterium]|nr:histidine kinase [bacterium]
MIPSALNSINVKVALSLMSLGLSLFWAVRAEGQTYHFKQYTANDGLPTNAVYGGIQDREGFIWFYTEHGISRFDGREFRNYTVKNGLPVNDVWHLAEDSQGRIWLNTFGTKLVAVEGDSVKTYYESTDPRFRRFELIINEHDLTIYERGTEQLLIPDGQGGVQQLPVPEILDSIPDYLVLPCSRDTFLQFHKSLSQITLVANNGFRESYLLDKQDAATWSRLSYDHQQSRTCWNKQLFIWSHQDSLLHYFSLQTGRLQHFNLKQVFGQAPHLLRYQQLNGQLQIQTNLGLFILDDQLKGVDTLRFQLTADSDIHRSFRDREGNYWVCTKDRGVLFLTARQRNAKLFTIEDQYKIGITHIRKSGDGTIVAGTRKGALLRLNPKEEFQLLLPELKGQLNDSRNVNAICFRDDRHLWVARPVLPLEYIKLNGPQTIAQPVEYEKLPLEDHGIPHYFDTPARKRALGLSVKDLAWHAPSQRLCVARGTHPYILHFEGKDRPQRLELLTSKRTYACTFSPDGKLWLGHIDGLATHTAEEGYQPVMAPEMIQGLYIQELAYDPSHETLWIGSDGGGIIALYKDTAFTVKGTEGLSINDLHLEDKTLLAATNQGAQLIRINPDVISSQVVKAYGIGEGLPSVETQAIASDSGAIYVGSAMGLAKISKQEAYFNYRHPQLYFSGIEVDEVPLPPDTSYTMQGVPYQLSFSFVGLSFKSLGDIRYFYQLKGVDEQVMQTSERQVRYTNLSPGKYTFTVLAEDNNQQRSEIHTVDITIHSNLWQQFMPLIIAMMAVAFILWLLYRWRLHRHRQQAEQENAINRQFAELELQALQAQMNPHFVFNSLSAIQYFIAANEKQRADNYLSKFAMLMRQFLESSKTRYLNLHQELHLIRLYIELEQMRFPNRFEAEVTVAPDINPYTTLIPTMLLQPFVENAINHGLFHKMAEGRLSLNIAKDKNQALICTLEDNGVGRAAAKGIQQKAGKAYRSRAMQITNERLHALRVIEGYDVSIKVTDLENEDGSSAGTRVRITVPEIE